MSLEDYKVLFLMEKSSIVIKGLEKRINAEEYETASIVENFDKIEEYAKEAGVFVVYNPLSILDVKYGQKKIVLIKDQAKDNNCNIIFVGEIGDKENITKEYPEFVASRWMVRPVDPDEFVTIVEEELRDHEKRLERKSYSEMDSKVNETLDVRDVHLSVKNGGGDKKRILIVDDDPSYAGMVKNWIKDRYKTDVVTAGMQAISFLLKKPVDLILLDYEMPVVDGPQVLQMLRQEPVTKDIPVVFLTGVSSREGVSRVMELKPAGYILKSTTRENLMNFLQEKLHG
ncbi:response regulator [Butyrivibrio sp. AC2005]|uniref:response regulator n=1 Tax=Butyrivibrio sp. AC2005 TaxID=1280672 RepID=UPI0004105FA6|nr:response regulator [Butyrivibrio sp. AC2005]